jgi:hypothetical protein
MVEEATNKRSVLGLFDHIQTETQASFALQLPHILLLMNKHVEMNYNVSLKVQFYF